MEEFVCMCCINQRSPGQNSRQCALLVLRGVVITIHQPVQTGLMAILTMFLKRSRPYTRLTLSAHEPATFIKSKQINREDLRKYSVDLFPILDTSLYFNFYVRLYQRPSFVFYCPDIRQVNSFICACARSSLSLQWFKIQDVSWRERIT